MAISETITSIGSGAMFFFIIMITVLLLLGIISFAIWFVRKQRKYSEYKCVIWEQDAFGQTKETYDTAGIFVEKKTDNKLFFLKKSKVGLNPDSVPVVPAKKGRKVVYLVRYGLKDFRFIKPSIAMNPGVSFVVGEEDLNWAINSYMRAKNRFNISILLQYLPFILLAFVSIIILIMFIYFFRQFGVLKDVAIALENAAMASSGVI